MRKITSLQDMAENSIKASANMIIKQIAEQNNINSKGVYTIIKNAAN